MHDTMSPVLDTAMSFQESKYLTSFVTIMIVTLGYARRAHGRWQAGDFDGEAGLAALGASVLWFVGALVVAGIVGQIVLSLLHGIAGGDVEYREDERDRLIEHRAMNAAFTALSVAFVAAMIGLIMGQGAVLAVFTILAGFVLGGLVADIWRIVLHRRGFRI